MKKIFVAYFTFATIIVSSCKKDLQSEPTATDPLTTSTDMIALPALTPLVPQLVAGKAGTKGEVDATGINARFDGPGGIRVASDGSLYLTDFYNSTIRKISTQNKVTTLNINPELFGDPSLFEEPDNIAILNDGTIAISSRPAIVLYKNGAVIKTLSVNDVKTNLPGYKRFSGLDKDPTGTFFYYGVQNILEVADESNSGTVDSFLGTVRKDTIAAKIQLLAHQSYCSNLVANSNGYRYFLATTNDGSVALSLNSITATGEAQRIFKNLNLNRIGSFVLNKNGTIIYFIDNIEKPGYVGAGAVIKMIKNNSITTLLADARPESLALANSEKFLYYTSYDNSVSRIALP